MASGRFYLNVPYNDKSSNCVEAYVDWSSTLKSGTTHTDDGAIRKANRLLRRDHHSILCPILDTYIHKFEPRF